jgi:hypothetical protein
MIGSSSGATIKITAAGGIKHPRINSKILSDKMRLNVKHYSVQICLPRLPNEIFVAPISSGFNFEEQRSLPRETCPFFCLTGAYLTRVSQQFFNNQ